MSSVSKMLIAVCMTAVFAFGEDAKEAIERGMVAAYDEFKPQEAIAHFTQAIKLDPNSAAAYNNRGDIYYELDDHKKAIEDFTQAIKIEPNDGYTYYKRAHAYNVLDDRQKAIADFTQAIKLDENHTDAYLARGKTYKILGDNERASKDALKAKELGDSELFNILKKENLLKR